MAISNQLVKTQKKLTLNQEIETPIFQQLIMNTLRDPKRAERFIARILTAVQATPMLKECDNRTVLIAGLQGEVHGFSPDSTLGEYYMVPRKRKRKNQDGEWEEYWVANYQRGVNGTRELALRTKQYNDIDTRIVRLGEYIGVDAVGRPRFDFASDRDAAAEKPIIGYMAYYEKTNGFIKTAYITSKEALNRAKRSDAFDFALYEKWKSGATLDWKEQRAIEAPWYKHFDAMAQNAVLKDLLKTVSKTDEMKEDDERELKQQEATTWNNAFALPPENPENDFFDDANETPAADIAEEAKTEIKTTRGRKKPVLDVETDGFFTE